MGYLASCGFVQPFVCSFPSMVCIYSVHFSPTTVNTVFIDKHGCSPVLLRLDGLIDNVVCVYVLFVCQQVFRRRDQLMSRANSLKKAIRQIIEQTEKGRYQYSSSSSIIVVNS